jgi:hypothetical protein
VDKGIIIKEVRFQPRGSTAVVSVRADTEFGPVRETVTSETLLASLETAVRRIEEQHAELKRRAAAVG